MYRLNDALAPDCHAISIAVNELPLYFVQTLRALVEPGVLSWVERRQLEPASTRWLLRVDVPAWDVAKLGRQLPRPPVDA